MRKRKALSLARKAASVEKSDGLSRLSLDTPNAMPTMLACKPKCAAIKWLIGTEGVQWLNPVLLMAIDPQRRS
jgi:hypothetical protein